ncbi:DUF1573 domain-containing protein [Spirosoma lituiforme]
MRKYINNIVYSSAFFVFTFSCKSTGRIKVLENNIDIGTHNVKNIKTITFYLKNTGNSNIKIKEVNADCTCTKMSYSTDNIEPDNILKIKVYNSDSFPGSYQSIITVYSNAKNSPNVLILRGKKVL